MRVLHVISNTDLSAGGPTRALVGLAAAQAEAGISVRIVATRTAQQKNDLAEQLSGKNIDIKVITPANGPLVRHPDIVLTLQSAIDDADVVHIHALWEEIQHQAAAISQARNVPYIIRPCGMLSPYSLAQGKWKKKVYLLWRLRKDLDHAAAIHYTASDEARGSEPLHLKAPAIVEPNGVDLSEFEKLPPRGAFRQKFPSIGDRPTVVFLSRLHPKKGLEYLIPAIARLPMRDAMLIIAGPDRDGYQSRLAALVHDHGLDNRVIFTGMLQGRSRIEALVDGDLFALPSHDENFGIAVVEALASGTPVLISDQVNLAGDVAEGKVGGIVQCNVDSVAAGLERWLTDATLREQAAARARPFVWERYDWKKIAARWKARYETLTAVADRAGSK